MLRTCTDRSRRFLQVVTSFPSIQRPKVSQNEEARFSETNEEHRKAIEPKVAAEVVYYVAKTHVGLVELPSEVDRAVDRAILSAGLKGRRLRLFGNRFLDHLNAFTRTQSRGGIFRWSEMETRRKKQKRNRGSPNEWVDAAKETPALQNADQWIPLPENISGFVARDASDPGILVETPIPSYEQITTAAFAATRFPGCYAALLRIFDEIALRNPNYHPMRMLDFGSGLGSSIWAAHETWKSAPCDILAVEPSWSMTALSKRIELARKKAESLPERYVIRRVPRLPILYGATKRSRQKYDLVVASYVLCEIPSIQERRRLVLQLWRSCADVIVFVEHGTPVGASIIQEVRNLLLEYETKRTKKQRDALPSNASPNLDSIVKHRLESGGIHVLAPCPHDGACPMVDKKMWCHFVQRYQRTRALKVAKMDPKSKWGPKDFQDERFSFVVMRRGWREKEFGKDFVDIQISPHFYQQIKPDEPNEWTPGKERKLQREEAFFSNASSLKQLTDSKQSGEEDEDTPSIKGNEKEKSSNALIKMRSGNVVLDDRVRYPDSLSQVRHVDWSILDPKGLKLSRLASHQWSRIIRQPRKRKGHIILDVCASCSEQKGCQGKLQRHIIAQSDRKTNIGDSGYIMAKKFGWGDLWPTYYNFQSKIKDM